VDTEKLETGEQREKVGRGHPPVEHRFKPGNQASKGVRRGKGPQVTAAIKRALQETLKTDPTAKAFENGDKLSRKGTDVMARGALINALKGNAAYFKEILARLDGPIPTQIEGGDPDKPIRFTGLVSDDELDAARRFLRSIGKGCTGNASGAGEPGERE